MNLFNRSDVWTLKLFCLILLQSRTRRPSVRVTASPRKPRGGCLVYPGEMVFAAHMANIVREIATILVAGDETVGDMTSVREVIATWGREPLPTITRVDLGAWGRSHLPLVG